MLGITINSIPYTFSNTILCNCRIQLFRASWAVIYKASFSFYNFPPCCHLEEDVDKSFKMSKKGLIIGNYVILRLNSYVEVVSS